MDVTVGAAIFTLATIFFLHSAYEFRYHPDVCHVVTVRDDQALLVVEREFDRSIQFLNQRWIDNKKHKLEIGQSVWCTTPGDFTAENIGNYFGAGSQHILSRLIEFHFGMIIGTIFYVFPYVVAVSGIFCAFAYFLDWWKNQ